MALTTGKATDLITFSRGTLATVTDADGKIKWAPHNLLTNSESFDASGWGSKAYVAANAAVAPNGTTTADRINNTGVADNVAQPATVAPGVSYTFSFWAKNNGGTTANYRVYDNTNLADIVGVTSYFSLINGSTWTQITVTFTAPAGCTTATCYVTATNGPTNNIFVWGAHLYRSDLGGMQANTSAYPMYNPTTPKNLLGYSEDFSNAAWGKGGIAAFGSGSVSNAIVAPNGLQTADKIVASNTASAYRYVAAAYTAVNGPCVISVYAKLAEYSLLRVADFASARFYASFDLSNGTVVAGSTGGAGFVSAGTPVAVGDGWYRCSIVTTLSSSSITFVGYPAGATLNGYGAQYAGDGTSGIYLWGAQLSDSASLDSYVPVYGAAVTSAAYYGPRRDFDSAGVCRGLLVEELRTNLIRYSRTLETTGSYWGGLSSGTANTITIDNAPGPDGLSTSASMITYNTAVTGAGTYSAWRHTLSTTANGTYTFSIWLKAGTTSSVYLRFNDSGGNRANTLCTLTSSWQRFTVTGTTTASITTISCDVGADGNAGGQTLTAGTIYAYGAQLEANASFATSYVPNGSTISGTTRNADVASVSTQAFPYSATEGTLVANGVFSTAGRYVGLYNTSANQIEIYQNNSTSVIGFVYASGTTQASVSATANAFSVNKIALAFKENDVALSANGGTVVTDNTAVIPVTNSLTLNAYVTSVLGSGWIRQITYIPRRLSNAELQSRTA